MGSVGAVGGLFYTGHIRCNKDLTCPIVPIVNLSQNKETSMSVAVMTVALFGLVFLTCCHIFLIALQKLRVSRLISRNFFFYLKKNLKLISVSGIEIDFFVKSHKISKYFALKSVAYLKHGDIWAETFLCRFSKRLYFLT